VSGEKKRIQNSEDRREEIEQKVAKKRREEKKCRKDESRFIGKHRTFNIQYRMEENE